MKILIAALVSAASLAADSPAELRAMVRKSLSGLNREDNASRDYLWQAYSEKREFDANGKEVSRTSTRIRRELRDGVPSFRTVERNGKPVDEAPAPRPSAPRRRNGGEQDWIQEFPEALDYKVAGEETIHGRPALIVGFEPRAGYKPSNMKARIFEKMRGRMWIDKAESELVKTDAEMFDTVQIGFGVLAKITKGTRFSLGRRKMDGGPWLMEWTKFRFDARFLFKTVRQEQLTRWEAYELRPDRPGSAVAASR